MRMRHPKGSVSLQIEDLLQNYSSSVSHCLVCLQDQRPRTSLLVLRNSSSTSATVFMGHNNIGSVGAVTFSRQSEIFVYVLIIMQFVGL